MQNHSGEIESSSVSTDLFPPGVRFYPTDEELIVHYLENKVYSRPLPTLLIGEIEISNYDPWELPSMAVYGEEEWYFFTPRDRKYPRGERPNRATRSGFWKATNKDRPILNASGRIIGVKKPLVFYSRRAQNDVKTDWNMTEYRLPDTVRQSSSSGRSMRLDDWVLCRIKQKGNMSNNVGEVHPNSSELVRYLPRVDPQTGHPDGSDGRQLTGATVVSLEISSNQIVLFPDASSFNLPNIVELPSVPTGGTHPDYLLLDAHFSTGQNLPRFGNIPGTSESGNIRLSLDAENEHEQARGIFSPNSIFQNVHNSSEGNAFQANELYHNLQQPTEWISTETQYENQRTTTVEDFYDQSQPQEGIINIHQ